MMAVGIAVVAFMGFLTAGAWLLEQPHHEKLWRAIGFAVVAVLLVAALLTPQGGVG